MALRPNLLVGLATLALMGVTGCDPVDGPFDADLRFAPTPPVAGENRAVLTLDDPEGEPIPGASVRATPYPPGAETGREPVEMHEQEEGRYVADPFELPEPGAWTLRVEITLPDGTDHSMERRVTVASRP